LASGVLAAGGRSEGLLPLSLEAGGVAAGLAALGKSGAYSCADAIAALTNNAAAVHIMFFIMAVLSGCSSTRFTEPLSPESFSASPALVRIIPILALRAGLFRLFAHPRQCSVRSLLLTGFLLAQICFLLLRRRLFSFVLGSHGYLRNDFPTQDNAQPLNAFCRVG
jgi:hypothetical protein